MDALGGTRLRNRLEHGAGRLPPPERYCELLGILATSSSATRSPRNLSLADASHHAAMLGAVLPDAAGRLDAIVEQLTAPASPRPLLGTVHGDLHEAQLVVDDTWVTGCSTSTMSVPVIRSTRLAPLVAHLLFRAMTSSDERIDEYTATVRAALSSRHDESEVDLMSKLNWEIAATVGTISGVAIGGFAFAAPDNDWPTPDGVVFERTSPTARRGCPRPWWCRQQLPSSRRRPRCATTGFLSRLGSDVRPGRRLTRWRVGGEW